MNKTIRILKYIGLYDPGVHCTSPPFVCVSTDDKGKKKNESVTYSNNVHYGGQPFIEGKDGEFVKANIHDGFTFDKEVTKIDLEFIDTYNENPLNRVKINIDKYTELKIWWAKAYSAKGASKKLAKSKPRNGWGYGERTLDNYWGVFNKVHSYWKNSKK